MFHLKLHMKQNSSLSPTHDSRGRYKLSDRRSNVNLQKTIVPKWQGQEP